MTSSEGCGKPRRSNFEGASGLLEALTDQPGLLLAEREDLSRRTTFRIGGPAEIFAEAISEEGLRELLAEVELAEAPFFFLGVGSNVLVPDEGLSGVVGKLGAAFSRLEFDGVTVRAGGAASLSKLARAAAGRGLVGLEALAGFPSTVGGAVSMNVGCHGTEICDVLVEVRTVDCHGEASTLPVGGLGAGYRTTALQESGQIVVEATFELARGDREEASARIAELNRRRWQTLPSGSPNVGSIFRNPDDDSAGRLIETCGLKGVSSGAARISQRHANVIVNDGGARAADVLELMVRAWTEVRERFDISLEPEVVLAGHLHEEWLARTGRQSTTA